MRKVTELEKASRETQCKLANAEERTMGLVVKVDWTEDVIGDVLDQRSDSGRKFNSL